MNPRGMGQMQEVHGFTVSFSSQYISVVLIILTFVIGAFASQRLKESHIEEPKVSQEGQPLQLAPVNSERLVGELIYNDLFEADEEEVNPERARIVAQFLLAHDIKLVTEIPVEGLDARPINLTRYLIDAGVPADALYIWGTSGAPTQEVHLKFLREEG